MNISLFKFEFTKTIRKTQLGFCILTLCIFILSKPTITLANDIEDILKIIEYPELIIKVWNVKDKESETKEVSNLEPVLIEIILSYKKFKHPAKILPKNLVIKNNNSNEAGNVEIYLKEIVNDDKINIFYNIKSRSSGYSGRLFTSTITVDIPISDEVKTLNINKYVDSLYNSIDKLENEDPNTIKLLKNTPKEGLVGIYEKMYYENKVGLYEISAKCLLEKEGYPIIEIESDPVIFEVINDGNFFDKPEYRIPSE